MSGQARTAPTHTTSELTSERRAGTWGDCSDSSSGWSRRSPAFSPGPSAARCSPSRSRPRSSASSTTRRRSSPASGAWSPTASSWSSPSGDLERLAPYDSALETELTEQLTEHARAAVLCLPRTDQGSRSRRPTTSPPAGSGCAARPRRRSPGHSRRSSSQRTRAVLEVNGTQHPLQPPGLVVGRGSEARHPDQRPGREPAARRVPHHHPDRHRGRSRRRAGARRGARHGLDQRHPGRRAEGRAGDPARGLARPGRPHVPRSSGSSRRTTPMSELTLFLVRIAYLAILWIFVLSAISVIRSDMFGARVPDAGRARQAAARRRSRRPPRGAASRPTSRSSRASTPASPPTWPTRPSLIGRGNDAAIRLDDDYVSTRHARIVSSGGQCVRRGPRLHQRHLPRAASGSPSPSPSAWARRSGSGRPSWS